MWLFRSSSFLAWEKGNAEVAVCGEAGGSMWEFVH